MSGGFIKTPATSEVMHAPTKVTAAAATFTIGITSSAGARRLRFARPTRRVTGFSRHLRQPRRWLRWSSRPGEALATVDETRTKCGLSGEHRGSGGEPMTYGKVSCRQKPQTGTGSAQDHGAGWQTCPSRHHGGRGWL